MGRNPASDSAKRRAPLARVLGLDANPLRRSVDRTESWIRIVLVAVFLLSAPLSAFLAGRWADAAAQREAQARATAVSEVSATVQRAVPDSAANPAQGAVDWVPARWRAPDGTPRTGEVQAPLGARANTQVKIWVDQAGRLSDPPLTRGQIISRVITAAALTPLAIALVLATVLGLAHQLLERRRMRAWEAAWSAVEPLWTRRTR